jgi:hypothetical protein
MKLATLDAAVLLISAPFITLFLIMWWGSCFVLLPPPSALICSTGYIYSTSEYLFIVHLLLFAAIFVRYYHLVSVAYRMFNKIGTSDAVETKN